MAAIKQTKEGGYDERWYGALESKAAVSLIAYCNYSSKQLIRARTDFNREHLDWPRLSSRPILIEESDNNISYLKELAEEISQGEKNIIIQTAYLKRIAELIDLNVLLKAAVEQNNDLFLRQTIKLYGEVDRKVLAAVCQFLRLRLTRKATAPGKDAMSLLRQGEQAARPARLLLETDIFQEARLKFQRKFQAELEALENLPDKMAAPEMKQAMDGFLSSDRFRGWQAKIDKGRSGIIRVEHKEKRIVIPEDKVVSASRFKELVVHEILTHVLRRQRGERSRLKLLGLGLSHYLPGEEAVAIFRQQLIKDAPGYPLEIMWRYFFIALCLGAVDGRPKNFRQVYDWAVILFRAEFAAEAKGAGRAEDEAWKLTIRIFRGTRGEAAGVCYTKDLVYLNGYSRLITVMRDKPERQELFDIGKLDVSNEEHVDLTRKLGL